MMFLNSSIKNRESRTKDQKNLAPMSQMYMYIYIYIWYIEDIEWGITSQVIFQVLAADKWRQFPPIIKAMISYLIFN